MTQSPRPQVNSMEPQAPAGSVDPDMPVRQVRSEEQATPAEPEARVEDPPRWTRASRDDLATSPGHPCPDLSTHPFFATYDSQLTETTDTTDKHPVGWLFYDGQCAFCRRSLRLIMPALRRAGFVAVPLQEPWVARRFAIPADQLMDEMRVLTPDGRLAGGADAFVCLARFIPWLRPLRMIARVPGAMPLLRRGYRWIAARRRCPTDACHVQPQPRNEVQS